MDSAAKCLLAGGLLCDLVLAAPGYGRGPERNCDFAGTNADAKVRIQLSKDVFFVTGKA